MKTATFLFNLLGIIGITLLITSCEEKKEYKQNDISFDTIQMVKTQYLDDEKDKPSCSIKLTYTYPTMWIGEQELVKLHHELNYHFFGDTIYENMEPEKAAEIYTNNYILNFNEEALASGFRDSQNSKNSRDYYSFYQIIESNVLFNERNFVSYEIKTLNQKASNINTAYKYVVLDLKTGLSLSEESIFIEAYRKPLNEIIRQKLLKAYKFKTEEELYNIGYFDIEDISPNGNFWLNNEGITYVYSEQEIGVASLGETRLFISYKELTNLLKKESPIATLVAGNE